MCQHPKNAMGEPALSAMGTPLPGLAWVTSEDELCPRVLGFRRRRGSPGLGPFHPPPSHSSTQPD